MRAPPTFSFRSPHPFLDIGACTNVQLYIPNCVQCVYFLFCYIRTRAVHTSVYLEPESV